MFKDRTACHLVEAAVDAVTAQDGDFTEVLDAMPAAVYLADPEGTITYYNPACVSFAGRTPQVGEDKWCVTWKLFTTQGEPLPHEKCPMAVAIEERKAIRDVEAIAERPDGSRVRFVPYPTPLYDDAGQFRGGLNLLMDVTEQRQPEYLKSQADKCRRLARESTDPQLVETLTSLAQVYEKRAN